MAAKHPLGSASINFDRHESAAIIWKMSFFALSFIGLFATFSTTIASHTNSQAHLYSYHPVHFLSISSIPRGGGAGGKGEHRGRLGSLLQIDPRHIVSAIAQYGNGIFPQAVLQDLGVLKEVCDCEICRLDLYHQELEILNWTISVPYEEEGLGGVDDDDLRDATENRKKKRRNKEERAAPLPALRVGRLWIKWDSYRKPCLNIELEDVDVTVEFTNLMLTRTNWNELSESGFPPTMYLNDDAEPEGNSIIRIRNITLLGSINLHIHSRPLNDKITPSYKLDFSSLKNIMNQINHPITTPPNQCHTTIEIYDILSSYIQNQVRKLMESQITEWARSHFDSSINTQKSRQKHSYDSKPIMNAARETLSSYANKVLSKTEDNIQDQWEEKFGFTIEKEQIQETRDWAWKGIKNLSQEAVLSFMGYQNDDKSHGQNIYDDDPIQHHIDTMMNVVEMREEKEEAKDTLGEEVPEVVDIEYSNDVDEL